MNKIRSSEPSEEVEQEIKNRYKDKAFILHKDFLDRKQSSSQRYLTFGESAKNYLHSSYGNIPVLAKKEWKVQN